MGYTRKILAEKDLHEKSVFYSDVFRVDLAESIHIHYRNFRLELSLEEWREFAKGIIAAYARWWYRGKPGYQPTDKHFSMYLSKVDPVAGKGEKSVIPNKALVELSQFADYIHVHYRNTRFEFSVDEFLEFADELTKAAKAIRELDIMQDYPKRIGYNHVIQPKDRVTPSKNPGGFVTHQSRFPDEKARSYDSLVLDESTGEWKKQIQYHDDLKEMKHSGSFARAVLSKTGKFVLSVLNRIFRFF